MAEYILIQWTSNDIKHAEGILEDLIESSCIACGTIYPQVVSHYRWKGVLEKTKECVIVMKTKEEYYRLIESYIVENHSYSVPEILAIPIQNGFKPYLDWIDEETS
jgi:periplasmic divalent cation tolerance protein